MNAIFGSKAILAGKLSWLKAWSILALPPHALSVAPCGFSEAARGLLESRRLWRLRLAAFLHRSTGDSDPFSQKYLTVHLHSLFFWRLVNFAMLRTRPPRNIKNVFTGRAKIFPLALAKCISAASWPPSLCSSRFSFTLASTRWKVRRDDAANWKKNRSTLFFCKI